MTLESIVEAAVGAGLMRPLDLQFARFMTELDAAGGDGLFTAACLASWRAGDGDVCVDLRAWAGRRVLVTTGGPLMCPELGPWRRGLENSAMVGRPGDNLPLILDDADRLYLARYWHYESEVARLLNLRRGIRLAPFDPARLAARVTQLFGPATGETDWQQVAAILACIMPLTVISGGPGTGKTHTVARLLALMQGSATAGPLRIGLAAPTGKAAARLGDAIGIAKAGLRMDEEVLAAIPDEARTLHRLIGFGGPARVRHDRDNPLHLDVLVVDEASMVDLPLMYCVLNALPEAARVVLLGDRDQLASVEAGHVMGDLCHGRVGEGYGKAVAERVQDLTGMELRREGRDGGFADQVVLLRQSFRFAGDSAIGRLAGAVNRGDVAAATDVLRDPASAEVAWPDLPGPDRHQWISDFSARNFGALGRSTPDAALELLTRARVLCALREGPWGVNELNRLMEERLRGRPMAGPADNSWYPGRPVMVARNDYELGLFNGDVGVALETDGILQVWFRRADGELQAFAPGRLPDHQTALAITVHKSQGSEFDEICLVLPEQPSPAVSRELIYTGITRARRRLAVLGGPACLAGGIERRLERTSGLRDRLWGWHPRGFVMPVND